MTLITDTPFAKLDAEGRLLSPVFKGATSKPGRFAFRGEIALEFQKAMADEKRPPDAEAVSRQADGKVSATGDEADLAHGGA